MKKKDFLRLGKWFKKYAAGFYREDPGYDAPLILKEEHSGRVCDNAIITGRALELDENGMRIAGTIGLLHDVGRFIQYERHNTFDDSISEDHAVLSLSVISKHKVLSGIPGDEKRTILKSIFYHNAATLPQMDERYLFFAKLIRDADKLDILKVFADYYSSRPKTLNAAIEMGLPDAPGYSEDIISALFEQRAALKKDVKTLNDFKLLQLSWAFDLNFFYSFRLLKSRGHFGKIAARLPKTDEIKSALEKVFDYVALKVSG